MDKKIRKAIFAGSFDPITNGHLDIICRASKIFDELQIGVLHNPNKKGLFSFEERVELIKSCTSHLDNIRIVSFDGLLVDYCHNNDICTLVRGVRSEADVNYELQMAHMNKELNPDIETIFLPTNTKYSFISSSLIACATGRPFKISIFILPCTFMLNLCQKSRTFMPILLLFTLPCPLQSHKCCPQAHFPVPAFHQHAYSYHLQQPYFS